MRQALLDTVNSFLLKEGFLVRNFSRSCFDILARKGSTVLVVKILEDANALSREFSEEMKLVAGYVHASPVILANRAGERLEDQVVYYRFDVPTVTLDTFRHCVANDLPIIRKTAAGLTVMLDGGNLKARREEAGYSQRWLSRHIGVTAKMVARYEDGKAHITLGKAEKLYGLFGEEIFSEVDIFSSASDSIDSRASSPFSRKYLHLGFDAADAKKSPFDVIARKEDELILTGVGDKPSPYTHSLSQLLAADNLVIFERKKPKDIPSLKRKEFMELDDGNDLIRFIKEF